MTLGWGSASFERTVDLALARLDVDRQQASPQLRPFFDYLEVHLFSPELDLTTLRRVCGYTRLQLQELCRQELCSGAKSYLQSYRLEAAKHLLSTTSASIPDIGLALGYRANSTFTDSFRRIVGLSPSRWRAKERQTHEQTDQQALDSREREAATVVAPPSPAPATGACGDPADPLTVIGSCLGARDLSFLRAERYLRSLASYPRAARRREVRGQSACEPLVLRELLLKRSRETAQHDKLGAVELARLALECLEHPSQQELPRHRYACLKAGDLVAIANAWRLALRFPEADAALIQAENLLGEVGQDAPILAKIHEIRASLRWYQRRLDEALDSQAKAIEILRRLPRPQQLASALALRASLRSASGQAAAGLTDLEEAVELIEHCPPRLVLGIFQNLVLLHLNAGQPRRAQFYLPRAKALSQKVDDPRLHHQLEGAKGLIAVQLGDLETAAEHLHAAKLQATANHWLEDAAIFGLTLASVYTQQERSAEAFELVLESATFLESLGNHQQIKMVLRLLQRILREKALSVAQLSRARQMLETGWRQPWGSEIPSEPEARQPLGSNSKP